MNIAAWRKSWRNTQTGLREMLSNPDQHQQAMKLFHSQHAVLHTAEMAQTGSWSYEDEIMQGLSEGQARALPPGGEHSIVWVLWHLARIEDVTMNLLVAGEPQRWDEENWRTRLQVGVVHTGNAMGAAAVAVLSAKVDVAALRAYRLAVGQRTREITAHLTPQALRQKVGPARIERVIAEGAVVAEASSVTDYWSKRDIAGLLLMPPTRHAFLHLNEASRIKEKVRRQQN